MEATNLFVKRLGHHHSGVAARHTTEERMTPELRDAANAIWDSVADRNLENHDGYYDPDAIVARALNIPKWRAIEARRGYRRSTPTKRGPSLPRVSILENSHAA